MPGQKRVGLYKNGKIRVQVILNQECFFILCQRLQQIMLKQDSCLDSGYKYQTPAIVNTQSIQYKLFTFFFGSNHPLGVGVEQISASSSASTVASIRSTSTACCKYCHSLYLCSYGCIDPVDWPPLRLWYKLVIDSCLVQVWLHRSGRPPLHELD